MFEGVFEEKSKIFRIDLQNVSYVLETLLIFAENLVNIHFFWPVGKLSFFEKIKTAKSKSLNFWNGKNAVSRNKMFQNYLKV